MWSLVEYVQNLWPFSVITVNDLRDSDRIVGKLAIPESTKHFVYAIREPESQAVIYVLSVQNLSERSATDVECLIREIKPEAVVVQIGRSNDSEIRARLVADEGKIGENGACVNEDTVPTSVFEVLKRCFMHKISRERYEDVAGNIVLREIFGVSFDGHFVAAKKAADEVGASLLMVESPVVKSSIDEDSGSGIEETEGGAVNLVSGLQSVFGLQPSGLVLGRIGNSMASLNLRSFRVTDDVQSRMVRSLSSYLVSLNPSTTCSDEVVQPRVDYEAPQFAKCIYSLLVDLHDMFSDIPSMGNALACAQKMLCDVNKGEMVDTRILSEVYAFQIAVEGLRIALNNAGRLIKNTAAGSLDFSDLPVEDKSHAILARSLRSQTEKYKSVVAVVDASGLAGLRKHWTTSVPPEIKDMVDQLVINVGEDGELSAHGHKKRTFADKPMVAVGAGATAILGASSLTKVIPASTLVKIATFHVPSSLQLIFNVHKALFFAVSKVFAPTKLVAPGMASSSLKGSAFKAAVSAEKIRAVAHSVIASAEKTSLSAMRTAFYEIMRKRQVRPIGVLPWATFGCSVATCTGLVVYGNGIECAAESFPVAPSIACLGRGIQSLHEASEILRPAESSRIQKSIESLLYRFKNFRIQQK